MIQCRYCNTTQHGECRAEHGGSCVVCGKSEPVKVIAMERSYRAVKPMDDWTTEGKVFVVGLVMLLFGASGLYLLT